MKLGIPLMKLVNFCIGYLSYNNSYYNQTQSALNSIIFYYCFNCMCNSFGNTYNEEWWWWDPMKRKRIKSNETHWFITFQFEFVSNSFSVSRFNLMDSVSLSFLLSLTFSLTYVYSKWWSLVKVTESLWKRTWKRIRWWSIRGIRKRKRRRRKLRKNG